MNDNKYQLTFQAKKGQRIVPITDRAREQLSDMHVHVSFINIITSVVLYTHHPEVQGSALHLQTKVGVVE